MGKMVKFQNRRENYQKKKLSHGAISISENSLGVRKKKDYYMHFIIGM